MKVLKYIGATLAVMLITVQLAQADWGWEKVRGNGKLTTKNFQLDKFTEVKLATQGVAYVEAGSENTVVIKGEENLLDYLKVEVREGVLVISSEDGYSLRPSDSLIYRITTTEPIEQLTTASSGDIKTPSLKGDRIILSILSSGDISVDNIEAKDLEISINSSGDIKVKTLRCDILEAKINSSGDAILGTGTAEEQDIRANSSGDYKAPTVESKEAYVTINSAGDVYINVSDYLSLRSNSSGDLKLVGNPKIDANMNSSGRIQRASI
jgi:hypothetical protein